VKACYKNATLLLQYAMISKYFLHLRMLLHFLETKTRYGHTRVSLW